MNNMYDPMTGEPIQEPEQRFDPMTGELLQGKEQEPEQRFDPMTGELLQGEEQEPEQRFDPMTGELLQGKEQEPEQRFDPMTGEALVQNGFDPMTGEPVYVKAEQSSGGKKHAFPLIGGVIAAVVVVAVVVIAGVANGTFLSKPMKVLMATKRTFSDQPQFMKDLNPDRAASILESGKYRLEVKMDADRGNIEGTYISTNTEKQLHADVSLGGYLSGDVNTSLTETQLKLYIPQLSQDVYVWNYTEECDGYLEDILDSANIDYEDLSDSLSTIYAPEKQEKNTKELSKTLLKQIKELKWRKEDSREFSINGKSHKAKGYGVTITEDDAQDFLDAIEDYIAEYGKGETELFDEYTDDLRDVVRDMPDIDCSFYIYKNRLAAICVDVDGDVCELLFKGGDFRMQNMELEFDDGSDSVSAELRGETKDSKESYEVTVEGITIMEMEYDIKSGKYEVTVADDSIEGEILKERNKVGASVEMDDDLNVEFVLTKDAKLEELPDREVDIMDMSQSDWIHLFSDGSSLDNIFDSEDAAAEEATEDAAAEDAI